MDLLVDDFAEAIRPLVASGWIITSYGRYDPTYVIGLTPTGKTFRLDAAGGTVTINVATRIRTVAVAKAAWMQGSNTVTYWLQAYNALPVNQR